MQSLNKWSLYLDSYDYKIIKCYEAALLGKKDMPYDVNGLVEQRQAVRDKINALQAEVKALRAEAQAE